MVLRPHPAPGEADLRLTHFRAKLMKSFLKAVLRSVGYEVRRYIDPADAAPPLVRSLRHLCKGNKGDVIFDVGAHQGQTENLLRTLFPAATIHCFEPFAESFDILQSRISGSSYAHNFGFAEQAGQRTFQSNPMDVTNSLLPLEASAAKTWSLAALRTGQQVQCRFETIDGFMKANSIQTIELLKIDTQGAEFLVLEGAANTIQSGSIKCIFLEIITAPTYQGQKDFSYYVDFLENSGFKLHGLYDICNNAHGELLQLDALFTLRQSPA